MRYFAAILFWAIAEFCAFGFVAAGEPGPNHFYFRVGYLVLGLAFLVAAVAALRLRRVE